MFKIAFFTFLLVTTTLWSRPVFAEDVVTENLKKRLQESLQSESSPTPTQTLRAYIGVIKDLIGSTLVINTKDGKQDIRLEDETIILRSPGNTAIKPENINLGDSIIAIGYLGADEVLFGRRLIVSSTAIEPPSKLTAMGMIKKIEKSALTLTIGESDRKILLTGKTTLKSPVGLIELADLEIGDTLIYTATFDKLTQTATILMRIKTAPISE